VNRFVVLAASWLGGCAVSHVRTSDGGRDAGASRSCVDFRDCAPNETCGGSDGTGYHCGSSCSHDGECPAGMYCLGVTCFVPCTPEDLSTCLPGSVCASGVCRDPRQWANDCTGHDGCPLGMGCHVLVSGVPACETVEHAFCDGSCPAGDPMFVCFDRECRPRR